MIGRRVVGKMDTCTMGSREQGIPEFCAGKSMLFTPPEGSAGRSPYKYDLPAPGPYLIDRCLYRPHDRRHRIFFRRRRIFTHLHNEYPYILHLVLQAGIGHEFCRHFILAVKPAISESHREGLTYEYPRTTRHPHITPLR